MSGSRSLQSLLRVACLGPKYSYSHLASVAKFGEGVEHVPVGSIAAVFEEVNRRHVHFGIVPLENSTDGRIADTLDMFIRLPGLKIRAEVRLRVRHCLLGKCELGRGPPGLLEGPGALPVPVLAGQEPPAGGADRGRLHGRRRRVRPARARWPPRSPASPRATPTASNVLAENIEDQANNVTRFAVIAERGEQPTGNDKTTMIIRLSNEAGSLAKAIAPFEKNGVNMTWIESFPTAESRQRLEPDVPLLRRHRRPRRRRERQAGPRAGPQAVRPAGDPRVVPQGRERRELSGTARGERARAADGL